MTEIQDQNEQFSLVIKESGLEQDTAQMITGKFAPFIAQLTQWTDKAKEIVVTDESQVAEMRNARNTRLILKDIRVSADKVRKALKEDSIRYGKAVQGVYNMIEGLIAPTEEYLQKQEDFLKIKEQERKEALKAERQTELSPYSEFVPIGIDLGEMTDRDYGLVLTSAKMRYEQKIADDKKAEEERILKLKAEEEEKRRVKQEMELLQAKKKEAEEALAKQRQIAEKEKSELEERLRKEKALANAKLEAQKRLNQQLKVENKAVTEVFLTSNAKDLPKPAAQNDNGANKDLAVEESDKRILLILAKELEAMKMPDVKSEGAKQIIGDTIVLLNKISKHIITKSEAL